MRNPLWDLKLQRVKLTNLSMHVLNLSLVESVYNLVLKQKHQNVNISRYSKSQVRIPSEKQNKEIDH